MSRKKRGKWESGNEAKNVVRLHLLKQEEAKTIFQIDNKYGIRYPDRAWIFQNQGLHSIIPVV